MKFSETWLREWVNPAVNTDTLVSQLTMAGIEVDAVTPAAGEFTGVVVAEVISLAKHPDADKLNVCQVSTGSGEPLQIVCGASNVRAGLKVPLATIGAVLPGDFKIKQSKLRGVESFGMLCSEKELGLAETSTGLLEFADDAPVGQDVRQYLQLDDQCLEVDLTPNRSDCLSVAGIARELGVLNQCDVHAVDIKPVAATINDTFNIDVSAPQACPKYLGRVVRNINANAQSPLWLVEKLRRSGMRSLGPAVDVTNYVMLELGQPMHAFDLDTLSGGIQVRLAKAGEKITLLDGKSIELNQKTLLIADTQKPLALAGVMGGEGCGVTDNTKNILLECAFFAPLAIAGRARDYGLHTDSSHRFERGVDPSLQNMAMERATRLLLDICGGQAGPVVEKLSAGDLPQPAPILLRHARITRLLGITFDDAEVRQILGRLGMLVEPSGTDWVVTPPAFRFDIAIEADLIEELIRVRGYNTIPRTLPRYQPEMKALSESALSRSQLRRSLIDRGYFEAITYSFVDPQWQAAIDPEIRPMVLANPISADLSTMRTSLWSGLIKTALYNLNRQQSRIRLFETGLVYIQGERGLQQQPRIAGLICGDSLPEQWGEAARKVDFFDIKGDVEALLAQTSGHITYEKASHPALHPGQSAQIHRDGVAIGWMGALHPQVQKLLDIDTPVYLFELEQKSILLADVPVFTSLSKFPEVRRDIAILIKQEVLVASVINEIRAVASADLKEVTLFDVYTGKGVDNGLKSVALGLILQGFSRTLTDEVVDSEVVKIIESLRQKFGATLRE
jgi:phenylalanyl-tRNA synthetase beta chain